ncbi:hypothetical protein [Leeuwenhoekiella sp. H156]|uniref:hypothetical protein n=1 Tax=Leeuwenhoekiella sp. H156 TaxID=3450128 RepID=UPI003FA43760
MNNSILDNRSYLNILVLIFIGFFVGNLDCLAQNTFPTTGNVGIGTTNPGARLHLSNLSSNNGILFDSKFKMRTSSSTNNQFVLENLTTDGAIYLRAGSQGGGLILNDYQGNVGVGTANPSEKLDVNGKVKINNTLIVNGIDTGNPNAVQEQVRLSGYGLLGNRGRFYITNAHPTGDINFYAGGKHGSGSHLMITSSCNLGIGTTNADAKLAVNGTIHSKEVKVDLNGWSDFVFEKDYVLPTLAEVQQHISNYGHLKDIPSASEVEKDGIFLGEMDAKLLQKIEEITLYLI